MLDWKKRCKYATNSDLFRHRIWESRCGHYRVVESKWLGSCHYPTRYYACVLIDTATGPIWDMISRHRKRGPAVEAAEKHARSNKREMRAAA